MGKGFTEYCPLTPPTLMKYSDYGLCSNYSTQVWTIYVCTGTLQFHWSDLIESHSLT